MSHPDEPVPAPPVPTASPEAASVPTAPLEAPPQVAAVAMAAPQAAPDASALASPLSSGAPYRVPAPPPALEPVATPELYFGPPPRKPRPLIGPALSVFAVMLWTFVVAGQFASSWTLGVRVRNGEATILLLFLTLVAWIASMRRSHIAVPPRTMMHLIWRAIGAGIVAFVLFVSCLVAATAIGSAVELDFFVAVVLVLISLLAAIAGAHLTSPAPPERTQRQRVMLVLLWIAGTLLTLVAGADLGAHG